GAARPLPALPGRPAPLAEAVEAPLGREPCVRVGSRRETMPPPPGANRGRRAPRAALAQAVGPRLGPAGPSAAARGPERLRRVVRARRAVACLTRVRRLPQVRQRPGRQGRLEL